MGSGSLKLTSVYADGRCRLGTASLEVMQIIETIFYKKLLALLITAQSPRLYRKDMLCTPCSVDTPNQWVKVLVTYLLKNEP